MVTQTEAVAAQLRVLLMRGEYGPGDRLGEKQLAVRLGVSRTPVRLALSELAQEGMLEYSANRGFSVRRFSMEQILAAIDVRELLEGMAAGLTAKRGLDDEQVAHLERVLLQGDGLLLKKEFEHRDIQIWSGINGAFHDTIISAAGNETLSDLIVRLDSIPLLAANTFAGTFERLDLQYHEISEAHAQHHWIFSAIIERDAGRAEQLMRQHIHQRRRRMERMLHDIGGKQSDPPPVPLRFVE